MHTDTWIDQTVGKVNEQIAHQRQQNVKHLHSEGYLVVICRQGIKIHLADTVQTKDIFNHNRAREDAEQPTDYQSDNRN